FSDKDVANGKTVTSSGMSLSGLQAGNYSLTSVGTTTANITKRDLTVTATGIDKVYDGNTTATVTLSTNKVSGDDVTASYSAASFDNPNGSIVDVNKPITVYGISISGTDAANYNLLNTTATTTANITQAPTTLTLTLSGYQVRYMDNLTYTAVIKPLNTATPLTGFVTFVIGTVNYTAIVVPIPGSLDGSVQAMVINQLPATVIPGSYTVTATFTSTNSNYTSGSSDSKTLTVVPRNADPYAATGFYVGDGFAWTTGPNTSTATVTVVAAIRDTNVPGGDVRGAKVSFYFVNGTTLTAIPSAQNLPVGLVDVTDGSVGTASAIVQLNIGSLNSQSFQIAVKVTGAYTNNPWDALSGGIVTVSKPVTGGFITGGSNLTNQSSSGYIKGAAGLNTDFQFDIQYTKSGTNPKGKVNIMVRSWYDRNGILDSKLHTYLIRTNAIALLAIANPLATGTFSAKANMEEQLTNGTVVSVESGATFQMVAFQNACEQKIAITYYRKAGGVWFSSNWDSLTAKSVLQAVNSNSKVFVSGGGNCSVSVPATTARTANSVASKQVMEIPVVIAKEIKEVSEPVPFNVIAYPNPSSQHFIIEMKGGSNEKVEVLVYDSLGRMVKHIDNSDGQQIKFGDGLPSGAYIAIVTQGIDQKIIRLIKQ
ncbi:YDG domain-containing protein, partial [Flavobacterium sp. LT1R49]|uniref:YDG domain-containing protein n=1 Tax=Flavobacterium arabinosi TaxID=3398737 RepID=UPI003A84A726